MDTLAANDPDERVGKQLVLAEVPDTAHLPAAGSCCDGVHVGQEGRGCIQVVRMSTRCKQPATLYKPTVDAWQVSSGVTSSVTVCDCPGQTQRYLYWQLNNAGSGTRVSQRKRPYGSCPRGQILAVDCIKDAVWRPEGRKGIQVGSVYCLADGVHRRRVARDIAVLRVKDVDPFLVLVRPADSEPSHRRYQRQYDGSHISRLRTSRDRNFLNVM